MTMIKVTQVGQFISLFDSLILQMLLFLRLLRLFELLVNHTSNSFLSILLFPSLSSSNASWGKRCDYTGTMLPLIFIVKILLILLIVDGFWK